ncbi:CRIB domain-containing protein RIC10-like isoform X1 [Zingiber officinale]|uniref:CRIB domain-containing protein RIC10-like isoform X1 n=1 Tax=Zingiber officinale TaxID=94328 RepID=UPI001C4C7D8B|nr:CRIB domain-containing protein RIC10-like isoform X1 [Zingiber officinale]
MAIKMKGIFKGIRYIFGSVQKEHEMEIGHPTDVKHIAHVGFDNAPNAQGASPSWVSTFDRISKRNQTFGLIKSCVHVVFQMNSYKTSRDFSSGSLGNFDFTENSWASLDFEQRELQSAADLEILTEHPCPDLPRAPKSSKGKKKKAKSSSSTRSSAASTDSYSTAMEDVGDQFRGPFRIYVN